MTTNGAVVGVHGDRVLRAGDTDQLGFASVAARLAGIVTDPTIDGSLVVGLEGRWGSGKSSILQLVESELDRVRADRPHSLVHFRPWLVGNRDALLTTLFADLSAAIDRIEADRGNATRQTRAKATKAVEAARDFSAALGKLGGLIELAGTATALGPVAAAGKWVKEIGGAAKRDGTGKSLDALKKDLSKALAELDHRIVVTIDDLDRLDPAETMEVLRLARSVADLPNLVYLICYDSEIIARNIEQAGNIDDGHAYLEKVVQLNVMVPTPEAFRLRYWFSEELAALQPDLGDEARLRIRTIADIEGGRQLRTPRAVNRALDAIRLLWPPLRDEGLDLPDLVWLQLIKDANPKLYRWIEDYCSIAAEVSIGAARVDDQERSEMLKKLHASVGEGYFDDIHYRANFAEQLPAIEVDYRKEGQSFALFKSGWKGERDRAIAGRRLKSPDHYRYYFALANPTHAVLQHDFDRFWEAVGSGPAALSDLLLEFHAVKTPRPMGKADMLLDRIRGVEKLEFSPDQAEHILIAFSEMLDEAYRRRPFDIGWGYSLWDRAERFVPLLLAAFEGTKRDQVVEAMFKHGPSISWLNELYRHDVFFQGRFGNEKKPEREWYFTAGELDRISAILSARYRAMTAEDFFATVQPKRILYTWSQGGDEAGARKFVGDLISDDRQFVRLIEILQSEVGTSEGRFSVLKRSNFVELLDFETARQRIADMSSADGPHRSAAQRLKTAFDDGENY